MWGTVRTGCRWLAAPMAAYGFGWRLAKAAAPVRVSGPLPEAAKTPEPESVVAGSVAMSGGDPFHSPAAVSGSKASAMAWAEAISGAGAQLCDEGFEDEALGCFRIAGDLLARVETWRA